MSRRPDAYAIGSGPDGLAGATTKDPVHYTGMALDGAIHGRELENRRAAGEKIQVVDVRSAKDRATSLVADSIHIPLDQLRELDRSLVTVTYCNKGVTGNAGQNVLRNLGFDRVYNLSGGNQNWQAWTSA